MNLRVSSGVAVRLRWTPLSLLFLTLLLPVIYGADPVYTPQTLNDSVGNFADKSSTISWTDLPEGDAYASEDPARVSEGLVAYYNLVHSFIGSVFMKGFPNEIIEKVLEDDLDYVISNYSNYVTYFIGYAICVVIGLLFLFIFPIVACCVCCCRCCCNNCGGKRRQLQKHADSKCRRYSFTIITLISTIFLLVGAICIYVNNDNTSAALITAQDTATNNLNDIKVFANNTLNEALHIIETNFKFVQDALYRDLDNIGYLIGIPLREQIKTGTNISSVLSSAYSLVDVIYYMDGNLTNVETSLSNLNTSLNEMNTAITTFQTNVDSILATCGGSCGSPPFDHNSAGTDIDSSSMPDLSDARTSMDSAMSINLTQQIMDAEAELDSIPERVTNDSAATVNELKGQISNLTDNLDDVVQQIEDFHNKVDGENQTIDLNQIGEDIESFSETIETYDKYRWYGGVGLASIVCLVAVLGILGVGFGFLGDGITTPPTKRSCVSNCGGIMLMSSAGLIMIFSALLMLLTFPTFMIGAPIHEVLCKTITDLDELDKLLQIYNDQQVGSGNYFLADALFGNETIELTFTGLLKDCRDGAAVFTAANLGSLFNIDNMLNYSKEFNVNSELDKLNVSFDEVNIYPTDLQTQLADMKSAVNISYSDFYTELNRNTSSTNLSALADEIDAYASGITDPYKTQLEAEADSLRSIEANELVNVEGNVTALNNSVATMEANVADIPTQIDTLDTTLKYTDSFIKNNGSSLVKTIISDYADRVLGIIDSFVAYTDDAVKNKMGSCEPVWNVYNSLFVYTFCYNFMDCFNGFWFSLGWTIFFFFFSMIFSIKLAKYYRRMTKSDEEDGSVIDNADETNSYGGGENGEKGGPLPQVFATEESPNGENGEMSSGPNFLGKNNKIAPYDQDCSPSPIPPPNTNNPDIQVVRMPGQLPPIASYLTIAGSKAEESSTDLTTDYPDTHSNDIDEYDLPHVPLLTEQPSAPTDEELYNSEITSPTEEQNVHLSEGIGNMPDVETPERSEEVVLGLSMDQDGSHDINDNTDDNDDDANDQTSSTPIVETTGYLPDVETPERNEEELPGQNIEHDETLDKNANTDDIEEGANDQPSPTLIIETTGNVSDNQSPERNEEVVSSQNMDQDGSRDVNGNTDDNEEDANDQPSSTPLVENTTTQEEVDESENDPLATQSNENRPNSNTLDGEETDDILDNQNVRQDTLDISDGTESQSTPAQGYRNVHNTSTAGLGAGTPEEFDVVQVWPEAQTDQATDRMLSLTPIDN